MLHPFRCFNSINHPELGIMTSHESSMVEFTQVYGFKINPIKNLSLSDY